MFEDVLNNLKKEYDNLGCALNFNTPFELLVATMLSAQTTDITVNKATEVLFGNYNTPEEFSKLSELELQGYIKSCGFYKTKSKNIINTSKAIMERYNGEVPEDLEDLIQLPGVGRKTANVVLSNAFGIPAFAVDTHVFRVSNRIGLTDAKNVEDTEIQLMKNIPKELWSHAHHWLIWHGRKICIARKPKCNQCNINKYCKYYNSISIK